MNWIIFALIFMTVMFGGLVGVDEYRYVLAEEVQSGKLILTKKAIGLIERGDAQLDSIDHSDGLRCPTWKAIIARAFAAKVMFERARLEMETKR